MCQLHTFVNVCFWDIHRELNLGPAKHTWVSCYSLSFRSRSWQPESVTA